MTDRLANADPNADGEHDFERQLDDKVAELRRERLGHTDDEGDVETFAVLDAVVVHGDPDLPSLPDGMHSSMEVRTQTVTVWEARVTLRHRDGRSVQACGTADTDREAQAAAIEAGLQLLGEEPADG